MNKTQEIWMQIDGYEDYSVSTCGRVMNNTGKILKPQEDGSGYYQVGLYNDGEGTTCQIHRLVALTFIPNPDNKGLVDHIDRDMNNNNISNLRWATATENNRNASKKSNNTSGMV